ncbi:MAG: endoribonuclease MazF [Asticcacaulis sp.]|uniref:endoribonuclease MazF n=1 Tax=Asticcacaulis sp. TaxID=1872648 RepID=UPI003F7B77C7
MSPKHTYIPDQGDIVWLDFDPQAGHEQMGRRPAIVLSPAAYNSRTSLMVCCPMTTKIKGNPWEVALAAHRDGVVLSDQIKSLDWTARNVDKIGAATAEELSQVRRFARALIGRP